MTPAKSERFLRFAFIVAVLIALSISALCSHLREQANQRVLNSAALSAATKTAADAIPPESGKMGLLTYLKRNRKRWVSKIKNNPIKWLQFKAKFKKIMSPQSTKKLDKYK
jgi:hypothetical protein